MTDITLYSHPYSRGRVVRWMLEELGVDYDVQIKEYGGSIKAPEYLAINPMGKVPAIKHGNVIVTEVAAICAYLADQYPVKSLAPDPQSPERGAYHRWMYFVAGPLEIAMTARAYNWDINPENAPVVGCGFPTDTENTLALALEKGPYLCGEQFTAADVLTASYIGWYLMQKTLDERPVFREYFERLSARPAAKRANELDDALMSESPMV